MATDQELITRTEARNGVTLIALSGELDMATVPVLAEQLSALEVDGAGAIMLDLRELSFIDSSGLQAFVQAHKRSEQNGHRFLLVGASPVARRLFEMTRTEFLLDATATADLLGRFTGDGSRPADRDGEVAEPHA